MEIHTQLKNNDFTKRGLILFLVSELASLYLNYSNQFNPLPSLSNNSAKPSASYSTKNARSFPPWIWYGVTAWTAGSCISQCPSTPRCCHTKGPLLVLFSCIYPQVKSQFWMKQRLQGLLIQYQRITKSYALLQELWSVGWSVSLATARSSVLSAQHKLLPNLQQAGTQMQLKESTERNHRASTLLGMRLLDRNHETMQFSNQHFGYFNRGQHLHIKPNNLFQP